jgi:hypothetical protein
MSQHWERSVPLYLQAGLWLMLLLVGLFVLWSLVTTTVSYGARAAGQWQGGGAISPFVFRAKLSSEELETMQPGTEVKVFWTDPAVELPDFSGKVLVAAKTTPSSASGELLTVEIGLEGSTAIPLGLAGEARVVTARKRVLSMFWGWLRGS